jgi:Holliday junction resolvasome RuvABC endonuclease subunit
MKIPVLGMDPSLTNWGLAEARLCLETGTLDTPQLTLVRPKKMKGKQIRNNSQDLYRSEHLAKEVIEASSRAKVIFVEIPVGSQSARSMASYGICIGILAYLRASGHQVIELTPTEVKEVFTGNQTATKQDMIGKAIELYPDAEFPLFKGEVANSAEHLADAIATIHAGANTPIFRNLMNILKDIPNANHTCPNSD